MKKYERLQLRLYDDTRLEIEFIGFTALGLKMMYIKLSDLEQCSCFRKVSTISISEIKEIIQIE